MSILDQIRRTIRGLMATIAQIIHEGSRGKVRPYHITYASLLLHGFVALAILNNQLPEAALFLAVFGLMDALDGELARLQGSQSDNGILLDAASDRVKEVIVYAAIGAWLARQYGPAEVMVAMAALGGSLMISYVKAKGEMIVASKNHKLSATQTNHLFSVGLMRYEIRTALLVAGLAFGEVYLVVTAIALLCWLTVLDRAIVIGRYLSRG